MRWLNHNYHYYHIKISMGQESGPNVAGPFANGVRVTGMKFVQNLNLSSRQKKDKLWIHSQALGGYHSSGVIGI